MINVVYGIDELAYAYYIRPQSFGNTQRKKKISVEIMDNILLLHLLSK